MKKLVMNKLNVFVSLAVMLFLLLGTSFVFADNMLIETFGIGYVNVNDIPGWTKSILVSSGRDDAFSFTGSSDGNYYAWISGDEESITKESISLVSYENSELSYDYYFPECDFGSDFLVVEWKLSSGSSWNFVHMVASIPGWNSVDLDLPSQSYDNIIDLRFRKLGSNSVFVDNVRITADYFAECGNSVMDSGEECDDGNLVNGDGCDENCQNEDIVLCGNNIIDSGEQCDDGNLVNGDGCDEYCQNEIAVECGNSVLELGEQCDDGNLDNGDGCDEYCMVEILPGCGNGLLDQGEQCDDSNLVNGDGCDDECNFEQVLDCSSESDFMLVFDRSGSMDIIEGSNTRMENSKNSALQFVDLLGDDDQIGLVSFATTSTLDHIMSLDHDSVKSAISGLEIDTPPPQRTNIGEGLRMAREEIDERGRTNNAIILLSDGAPNEWGDPHIACWPYWGTPTDCTDYALNQANLAKDDDVEIFVIAVGVNNDTEEFLKQIASGEDHYFFSPDANDLQDIYSEIVEEECPCDGYDCSINTNICNTGYCDEFLNQCVVDPLPEGTYCETDDDICTEEQCDAYGNCVFNPYAQLPLACMNIEIEINDSKVAQALPDKNFGLAPYLYVNPKTPGRERTYLLINASPLLSYSFDHAELQLAVYYTGQNAPGSLIYAYYCPDHIFDESSITWNNQPLDSDCVVADTFSVPERIIAGIPESWHSYDIFDEIDDELNHGDGIFTIVLVSSEEGSFYDSSKYVEYISKDYNDEDYRPRLIIS